MTRNIENDVIRPPVYTDMGSGLTCPRMVSVLLIFNSPNDLDRICHQLEKNANIIVDLRVSDEDAIHLMHYVPFDVVVTEYNDTRPDRMSVLKTIRSVSMDIPVIYYLPSGSVSEEEEAKQYDPVYFVSRNAASPGPEPDALYPTIMQIVAGDTITAP